ncbi:MAG: 1,4-alpha-glucan branching protein domain-containing protein [Elusimicrobiales bacterium]
MSAKGLLSFVICAHKPFARQGENGDCAGEEGFFSAVANTYAPLVDMAERLSRDNIRPAFTVSLSPSLCAMLEDEQLGGRLRSYIEAGLGDESAAFAHLRYESALAVLDRYSGDLVTPLKQLQQNGQIEVITSTATHAVLPLFIHPECSRAQVSVAGADYQERFSRKTRGLWLAGGAFEPRLSQYMQLAGINYVFLPARSFECARPKPKYGLYAPARLAGGALAFACDAASLEDCLSFSGSGGGVYLDCASFGAYDAQAASRVARAHAEYFLRRRLEQAEAADRASGIRPVITCACDADLFGGKWFEGLEFLEHVIRFIRQERLPLQMVCAGEAVEAAQAAVSGEIEPDAASLSGGGYFEQWLSPDNDWIYPRLNAAAEKMVELANRFQFQDVGHIEKRALNQAARELMLAQSSDWAMQGGGASGCGGGRVLEHCGNFDRLAAMVCARNIDEAALRDMETRDNIFFNMDFRVFASASAF